MQNSTRFARLLEACHISSAQFVCFLNTSAFITPRQRSALIGAVKSAFPHEIIHFYEDL